ncbi:uncharacterized protein LODBEIA_P00840 [Lodderomyces beijingensis]|uniref:Uncharacterized protein n=1 Tax=Lodderomyces beijingensis TaxID=1775926 RepID=A0ABP0ZCE7_9ASCO
MSMSNDENLTLDEIDYDILPPSQDNFQSNNSSVRYQRLSQNSHTPSAAKAHDLYRICLPPDNNITNQITNELFQVTRNSRNPRREQRQQQQQQQQQQQVSKSAYYHNVWKPTHDLEFNNLASTSFELDDVDRTKVFQGRLKRPIEEISPELRAYFYPDADEDKENLFFRPAKLQKTNSKQRSIPLIETNNFPKRNPLEKRVVKTPVSSPERLCQPRHQHITPSKPSLQYAEARIFLIESSTGLTTDATKFATELNSSCSSNLIYPDNENEVIQIPTTKDSGNKTAIIRMFCTKSNQKAANYLKCGFYSENELQVYKEEACAQKSQNPSSGDNPGESLHNSGVQLLSQSRENQVSSNKKQVRWADKLEW